MTYSARRLSLQLESFKFTITSRCVDNFSSSSRRNGEAVSICGVGKYRYA